MKRKQRAYQNDPIEIETLYKAEEPFMPIDKPFFGYQGIILRNKINDTIQCHLCGLWFKYLAPHLKHAHTSDVYEYKKKFSLPLSAALCSKKLSSTASSTAMKLSKYNEGFIKNQSRPFTKRKNWHKNLKYSMNCMGRINQIGACEEQVQSRFISIMDFLGREPLSKDLEEHDHALKNIIQRRYGGLNSFRTKFNLGKPSPRYTREKLIAEIHSKYNQFGKSLQLKHFNDARPSRKTILKRFGSWNRALVASGIV